MHWTEKYTSIPYKIHGRDKTGLDCWGLAYLIYKEKFSVSLPSYDFEYDNNNTAKDTKTLDCLYKKETENKIDNWIKIPVGEEKEGDLILMPFAGIHIHIAICIGEGKIIHVMAGIDVTIESYLERKWKPRYMRSLIFRHPKVII